MLPLLASKVGCPMLPTLLFRVVGFNDTLCLIRILPFRFLPIQNSHYSLILFGRQVNQTMLIARNKCKAYLFFIVHIVGVHGLEPCQTEPKSVVLPLHHTPLKTATIFTDLAVYTV